MQIDTKKLLAWIERCNHKEKLEDFLPFMVAGQPVGALNKLRLPLLQAHPEVFVCDDTFVSLHPDLNTSDQRSAALEPILRNWHQQKVFFGWRDELYRVATAYDAEPLLLIERAATSTFGVRKYGVHLNGLTWRNGELHIWVARRSYQSPTYPGMLDQMVAGGLGAGYSALETLVKECAEEADMPADLATQARAVGVVSYCTTRRDNWVEDVLFLYDLELPENFVPENTDGEVDSFICMSVSEVVERLSDSDDEFKLNANLVVIDFLLRQAYLTPEMAHYVEIAQGLRASSRTIIFT